MRFNIRWLKVTDEMAEDAEKATLYRKRAVELRGLADDINDRKARVGLIEVALSYEKIADSLERIE